MLIAAVVIASFITLSSAQLSPECSAAYDAVFTSTDNEATDCATAYYAALTSSATDEQMMMVCNVGQQCNIMIESIITQCGHMVSL